MSEARAASNSSSTANSTLASPASPPPSPGRGGRGGAAPWPRPGAGGGREGKSMRAIVVHETGGPEALHLEDVPVPEPGPGQVRVRVHYAGVNFIDVYHRTGLYALERPFTPGSEAAGEVDAVGPGVSEFR